MITTEIFSIRPGEYIRKMAINRAWRYGWAILVPLLAMLVAGCMDVRFMIVALMWLFIVVPSVMLLVFLNCGLTENARLQIMPHYATISPDKITLTFVAPTNDKNGDEDKDMVEDWEMDENKEEDADKKSDAHKLHAPVDIISNNIIKVEITEKFLVIHHKTQTDKSIEICMIPKSAVAKENLDEAMGLLSNMSQSQTVDV